MNRALVTGAGGFIGHHLVRFLKSEGYWVRGTDVKACEFGPSDADEFEILDLRREENCLTAASGVGEVYHLAANMGGIGYISSNHADISRDNVLMDAHMLQASYVNGADRFFYSSSACIYPLYLQTSPSAQALKESDAVPADPEEGYGWEKLYAEKLCEYYNDEGRLQTRVARFHNVYGPLGTYEGGREKAPAAICRKVALTPDGGELKVWGDGKQTRSFMYVDDCVEGIYRITQSDHDRPLNLGRDDLISIDGLVDLVSSIAAKNIIVRHDTNKPQGVRGRNSDNSQLRDLLGWEPTTDLRRGLTPTYTWIREELEASGRTPD